MRSWRPSVPLVIVGIIFTTGCGGGGGSTPPISTPPSFTIGISPASISVAPGTTAKATVALQGQNGFSGSATVTLSGLPAGVTVSPASPFTLLSGGQELQITAASGTANGDSTLSLNATSGTLTASASASVKIAQLASFSVVPSEKNLNVQYGGSASTTISFSPGTGATDYTLQLEAAGVPGGISASFSGNPAAPSSQSTFTLTAPSNGLPISQVPFTITAMRSVDGAQQSAQLTLTTAPPAIQPTTNRSDFVRTDDTPSSVVYDSIHGLVFACEANLSRVDVISIATKQIVRSIPVPGATGLTITPDNSLVYVGGNTQELVAIDTATMAVAHRYILPLNAGQFFSAPSPVAVSDGTIFMPGYGSSGFGFYNPATGNIDTATQQNGCALGSVSARSADGTKILLGRQSYPGFLSLIDVATASCVAQKQFTDYPLYAAANPSGTQFAVIIASEGLYILDANMNVLAQIAGVAGNELGEGGVVYSRDGSLLFVVSEFEGHPPLIYLISTQTFQVVGTAPAIGQVVYGAGVNSDNPMDVDATGLIFSSAFYGVAFEDAAYIHNFTSSALPALGDSAQPAEGSPSTSTPVTIPIANFSGTPTVWFGSLRATNVSESGPTVLQVTAPPSTTSGPVNVKLFDPDGQMGFMPQAFSYGPSAITYGTLAAGPQGGPTADLYGNGFSADVSGAAINVKIGGQSAPVTAAQVSIHDSPLELSMQHLQVTVPAGSAGAQNITITNPAGSTTIAKGFHYLESVEDYSTSDNLLDILYDSSRQRLYMTAGSQVDVFSLSSNTFLAPITPPNLGGGLQLAGLALTPDGSKLLVANVADRSVAIINPDNPSAATAVLIAPNDPFGPPVPFEIAPTSLNTAFIVDSLGYIYILDLASHQVTLDSDPNSSDGFSGGIGDSISASRDGSTVCLVAPNNDGGPMLVWTAASNSWTSHNLGNSKLDGSMSGDGNVCSSVGPGVPARPIDVSFVDTQANQVSIAGVPDFLLATSGALSSYTLGNRIDDSGSLDYIPYLQSVDIFDVNHGDLRERILLTEQVSTGVAGNLATRLIHSMAIDETGQHLFLLTNKGLTIAQLDVVPLSIGSVTPSFGPGSAPVKIRGSGFVQGTTATANGTAAVVTYVDASTLQVALPSLAAGAVQIKLTNPDGQTYSLDDAYTVQ